ncbi:MAG: hypothetical protein U1E26_01910 [Coriobacteriia bacterium]|nr:hypothetical protein [Coriobacteriia bacterium]
MDDQGFDFRKESDRREPKRFEPPPWERDAFEELQLRRAVEPDQAPEAAGAAGAPEAAEVVVVVEPTASSPEPEAPATRSGPSDAEVTELLAGLAAQEPDVAAPAVQVTIGASIVLLPIGVMMLFWGMAALAKAASAQAGAGVARTGAAVLIVFGAGFVGSAFWLIYRLLKQRGDL